MARPRIDGLHDTDGGHSVHGGIAFPLDDEPDEALATPAEAGAWAVYVLVVLLALLFTAATAGFIKFVL